MSHPEFPADQTGYPEASQATTAMILGILGLVTILGPVAWWMAKRELNAIDSGRRSPENRGTANVARVLGIIGTVVYFVGLLYILFAFGLLYPS